MKWDLIWGALAEGLARQGLCKCQSFLLAGSESGLGVASSPTCSGKGDKDAWRSLSC